MKVLSLMNIKGGVAKTVSSVNFAACLVEKGYRVLLIDLDPQSNATNYLQRYDFKGPSTYDVLMGGVELDVIKESYGINLVPGNIKMIIAENEIMNDTRRSRENRLKKFIKKVEDEHLFDYVIIDCPPSLGVLSTNALVASTHVLVPIKIDKFGIDGLEYLLETVFEVKEELNPGLEFLGAFITMDKPTKVNKEIKEQLREVLQSRLLKSSIRENVAVIKSTILQTPVVIMDPKANASKDYRALCEEVVGLVRES